MITFSTNITLKDFTTLTLYEQQEVLSWRNNELVRKQMFTSELFDLADHLKFIQSLLETKTKQYYKVERKDKPIGVIDFYEINTESAFYGMYLKPELIGNGAWGVLLEYIAIDFAFKNLSIDTLQCESLITNREVLNIHTFFELSIYEQTKKICYMNISKEEWEANRDRLTTFVRKFL